MCGPSVVCDLWIGSDVCVDHCVVIFPVREITYTLVVGCVRDDVAVINDGDPSAVLFLSFYFLISNCLKKCYFGTSLLFLRSMFFSVVLVLLAYDVSFIMA